MNKAFTGLKDIGANDQHHNFPFGVEYPFKVKTVI